MDENKYYSGSDDDLVFLEEDADTKNLEYNKWKVLIVDDEVTVHTISNLVLNDFIYEGKGIEILNAYSSEEAEKVMEENPDIAVILLDVVMEDQDSGLKLVKYIRQCLNNKLVRIILRTGQPGFAPERKVIIEYDINDYKLKSELTSERFIVSVVTALRSYNDLLVLSVNKKSLEKIIDTSYSLFSIRSFSDIISEVLPQLISILELNKNALKNRASGFTAIKDKDKFVVKSAAGEFVDSVNKNIDDIIGKTSLESVKRALNEERNIYTGNEIISYIKSQSGAENLIYLKELNGLNEFSKDMVEIFCSNLSIALDNIILNRELEMSQREIIFTLGEIAEGRSKETGQHVKKVAEYTNIIALGYGMSPEEAGVLRMAASMHDIGKIGIPDSVLHKPGKFTPEEYEIMKKHCQLGCDMLKNSNRSIMKAAAIIALEHHEKYDGTGYPKGLKGEDIHIYGRITAIADVFDALGRQRVYKNAWKVDEIFEYLRKEKGKHFDPTLLDVFFNEVDKILGIMEHYTE